MKKKQKKSVKSKTVTPIRNKKPKGEPKEKIFNTSPERPEGCTCENDVLGHAETCPLSQGPTSEPSPEPAPQPEGARLSMLDAAKIVLNEAEQPMRVTQILEEMQMRNLWTSPKGKTPQNTLAAAINTEILKLGVDARFVKVGRGLFKASDR